MFRWEVWSNKVSWDFPHCPDSVFLGVFVRFMGFVLAWAFLAFPLFSLNFLWRSHRVAFPQTVLVGKLYGKNRVCTWSYGPRPVASEELGRKGWSRNMWGRDPTVGWEPGCLGQLEKGRLNPGASLLQRSVRLVSLGGWLWIEVHSWRYSASELGLAVMGNCHQLHWWILFYIIQ